MTGLGGGAGGLLSGGGKGGGLEVGAKEASVVELLVLKGSAKAENDEEGVLVLVANEVTNGSLVCSVAV